MEKTFTSGKTNTLWHNPFKKVSPAFSKAENFSMLEGKKKEKALKTGKDYDRMKKRKRASDMISDRELIEILRRDPDEGLRRLTSAYGGLVFSVVRGASGGGSERDLEECAADAITEFYLSLGTFDFEKGSIKAYLCMIARHNAIDLSRKTRRAEQFERQIGEDEEIGEGETAEEVFFEEEDKKELIEAVKALGPPDSEIIVRKFYFGQTAKEIAKKLGMTPGNVDVRVHRALKKLRIALEGGSEK